MLKFFNSYLYLIICLLLVFLEAFYIQKGLWAGDFWEHSAVIKELSQNMIHPSHPILNIEHTHAFFSPYSLIVAIFSRISGLNSILSLQVFAFVNLFLLLFSFYYFCSKIFKDRAPLIAAIGLVFILFYWGSNPYLWSGFYHIFVLNYILPYPSTFAMGLCLLALGLIAQEKPAFNTKTALLILLNAIVFLSHPYTGIFLIITTTALMFTYYETSFQRKALFTLIIIFPALFLSCLWPYYNFLELTLSKNLDFHLSSQRLYTRILGINWPLLLTLPAVLLLKQNKQRNFLFLSIAAMVLLYILGYALGFYGFSRILSAAMLFSQLLLAYSLVSLSYKEAGRVSKSYLIILCVLFMVSLYKNASSFKQMASTFVSSPTNPYKRYEFLNTFVSDRELVLANVFSNWYIPSFSGKVIASANPLYLVEDNDKRRRDAEVFFDRTKDDTLRERIIRKYKPDYILLDLQQDSLSDKTYGWLNTFGKVLYKSNKWILIKKSRK